MARSHQITINGESFPGRRGELLLDAALSNGIDLNYDCRAGHCGSCCVRLVSGEVHGGEGAEPGIVHACQCRIVGDAVIEKAQSSGVRTVEGVLSSLRRLSSDVMEVGIRTERPLPYHAGQYAQLRFNGYPSRPFSLTHPLIPNPDGRLIWFHIRRNDEGRVTKLLGKRIKLGHKVKVTGPYGSAHFRPNQNSRLILIGTSTGFAPIWSIAVAALRENPQRRMMIIAGGRNIESLYMGPALGRLARFPNVRVVPCCSTPQNVTKTVKPGRPTDYMPRLHPSDVLYVCGAPGLVDTIRKIAARFGAVCHADPFVPSTDDTAQESILTRAMGWLAAPTAAMRERIALASQPRQLALEPPRKRLALEAPRKVQEAPRKVQEPPRKALEPPRKRREQPVQAYRRVEAELRVRRQYGPQSA